MTTRLEKTMWKFEGLLKTKTRLDNVVIVLLGQL